MEATNERGSTKSVQYLSVVLARVSEKPSDLIEIISTTKDMIEISIPRVTDDGGSTILAYQLLIDDGLQGEFSVIYEGIERSHIISDGIF